MRVLWWKAKGVGAEAGWRRKMVVEVGGGKGCVGVCEPCVCREVGEGGSRLQPHDAPAQPMPREARAHVWPRQTRLGTRHTLLASSARTW